MKKISLLTKLLAVFAVFAMVTSCEPEVFVDNPSVNLVEESGFVSADATVNSATTFTVKLSADKADGEMNSLTITQDGTNLETTAFTIDGAADNNPKLLFDGDRSGFTYEIAITAPETAGIYTYSFKVDSDDTGSGTASIDITVEEVNTDPVISNDMNSSVEIENPSTVQIVLTAVKGSSPLNTIAVYEEGSLITDLSRLSWESTEFAANPNLLEGADKDGFTSTKLFLKSQNTIGTTNYTITLTDEAEVESSINYAITLLPLATNLSTEYTAVQMFNNSGTGFGAFDLETGTNVSSTGTDGDLVDLGNDSNGDWRMQIAPLAPTTIKSIDAALTYAGITSVEALQTAYDNGTELIETGTLSVGSTYVAEKNDKLFLFTITAVDETSMDNNDSFTISMKTE